MELKYLITFKKILEEGSFAAAATKLHYTQSTITFQIGQLENETQTKLFEKIGRRMVLTSAGNAFVPYVEQVLKAVGNLDNFHEDIQNCSGELQIGVAETFLCYRLPEVLKEIVSKAPKARLMIHSMNCYDIRDALNNGSLDIGIFYQDIGGNLDSLQVYPLKEYPVVALSSPNVAGLLPPLVEMAQSCSVPFLINEKNCIFRQIFEQYLGTKHIAFTHTVELESIETIKKLVQNDVGITFLPRFTVEKELNTEMLAELPTEITHNTITVSLAYHRQKWLSPLMQLFIDTVTNHSFQ